MEYNYANEILNDSNDVQYETAFVRRYGDPKEKIVNEQAQDIAVNSEDEENDADEALVAFEEGLKNDNAKIDEGKINDKKPLEKNK